MGQLGGPIRIDKLQDFRDAGVVSDKTLLAGNHSANDGKELAGKCFAVLARYMALAAKSGTARSLDMIKYELTDAIDDGNRVEIAFTLCATPREEPVRPEHDTVAIGLSLGCVFHHQTQLKPRTLPWNPREVMIELSIKLLEAFETIGRSGQCNAPVRMEMIHMAKRKKGVQRRIDGGSDVVLSESAERIELYHFVLVSHAAITVLEANELLEKKSGKAAALDASEVAAASFYPQDFRGSTADRIGLDNLGAGISAAEICDAQIGAQKIGAIPEQFRLVKFRCHLRIPKIFQIAQFGQRGPRRSHELLQAGNAISAAIPVSRQ